MKVLTKITDTISKVAEWIIMAMILGLVGLIVTELCTACVMFDLNNLKTVNDRMGHSAGDQLILSFARILRRVIPEKHFVGRYGGDEFMAVIYHTDRQEVEGILDSLRREADAANRDGNQLPLSYAYGWAISADYEGCIMQTLLDKADYCMYENKRAYYATHDRRAPRS